MQLTLQDQKEYEAWLDSTAKERECPFCGGDKVVEMQPAYPEDPNAGRLKPCICQE